MGGIINFTIAPEEASWWQVTYDEFLQNEGAHVTVDAVTFEVESGLVTVDSTTGLAHSVQIGPDAMFFWADAAASLIGDNTMVKTTFTLSNGEEIPRWIKFATRKQ
jgi:hypothetical protein